MICIRARRPSRSPDEPRTARCLRSHRRGGAISQSGSSAAANSPTAPGRRSRSIGRLALASWPVLRRLSVGATSPRWGPATSGNELRYAIRWLWRRSPPLMVRNTRFDRRSVTSVEAHPRVSENPVLASPPRLWQHSGTLRSAGWTGILMTTCRTCVQNRRARAS